MALGGGLALMGLYHIGPSGFRHAADSFAHHAGDALGGLGHGVTRFAHDVEDTFQCDNRRAQSTRRCGWVGVWVSILVCLRR